MNFQNLSYSFEFNGTIIKGVLSGDIFYWEYKSKTELFLYHFPNGIISSKTILTEYLSEKHQLVVALHSAMDLLID